MALKIEQTAENGVVSQFHRITTVQMTSFEKGKVEINADLSSYVNTDKMNKEAFNNTIVRTYNFIADIRELEETPIYEFIYKKLKDLREFADADDIIGNGEENSEQFDELTEESETPGVNS